MLRMLSRTASVFADTDTAKCLSYPVLFLQTSILKLVCLMQPGQPGMNGHLERQVSGRSLYIAVRLALMCSFKLLWLRPWELCGLQRADACFAMLCCPVLTAHHEGAQRGLDVAGRS